MVDWKDKNTVMGLIIGQILSLILTSTGFSSSELASKGFDAPTSQSFFNYVLLALVYGSIVLYRKQPLKAKWYYYILLALVDVEGNYLVVKAYQYTSLTSVSLLDCWILPCVLFLTWFILKTNYGLRRIFGLLICIAGLVTVVFSDVHSSDSANSGKDPIRGDLMVLGGATLCAICNVTQEFFVNTADWIEMLAFSGFFGAIISAGQIAIFERSELQSINWSSGIELPLVGYVLAFFLFYSGIPISLKITGSTMFNLSLLTSDMWAVLIRIFVFNQKVDWLFFVAFSGVAVGLVVYSWEGKSIADLGEIIDVEAGLIGMSKLRRFKRWIGGVALALKAVGNPETTPLIETNDDMTSE